MKDHIVILRSNPIAPDPRVEKIARSLASAGYGVTALSWDRSGKLPEHEEKDGLNIIRLRIQADYGTGLMNLPALIVWQIRLLAWLIANRRSYQVIHACDFDTILPALVCKRTWNVPVIYDIFDFYADHLRRTPHFIKQVIRRVDFWAIGFANGVILVDDSRREQIRGSHPKHIISIYNSPEEIPLDPIAGQDRITGSALRITYVGLLQVERGLFEMIALLRCHPEWHLDLAGFGGDEKTIIQMVEALPNITWHGRISYPEALRLSRNADILFATYDPAIPNHRYASPNKVFEAMMLGKPLIVAKNTNMDGIVKDANCGILVEYGNQDALENALVRLADDPELRELLGKNAREAYESIYSWQKMQARLLDFYVQTIR